MKNIESRIKEKLSEQSMTIQRLATESGVSEPTIHAIFNRGDAKLSQLEKIASALKTTLSFFLDEQSHSSVNQAGDFNQAGTSNSQKIKVSKAPAQELASELAACQRELEVTRALVASKDELISFLRGTYTRPN